MRTEKISDRKLDTAIKNHNVKQADELVEQLLKEEGVEIHPSIPEGFADQIRFASKEGRSRMKYKMIKTAAMAAACILGVGGTAYAAAPFIQSLAQDGKGAVIYTQPETTDTEENELTVNEPTTFVLGKDGIKRTEDDWYQEIYKDEKAGKYTYQDESPSYTSDDGKTWVEDKEAEKRMVNRYVFDTLQKAFDQAGIENILTKLEGDYALTGNLVNCYEAYSDKDSTIRSKSVRVVMQGKDQKKVIAEIDKSMQEEEAGVTAVINGLEVENYREIMTSTGVSYALQDVKDKGNEHVAGSVLSGKYSVFLKFYNLSEKEITDLLEKVDVEKLK